MHWSSKQIAKALILLAFVIAFAMIAFSGRTAAFDQPSTETGEPAQTQSQNPQSQNLWGMSAEEAMRRSAGCLDCHNGIEDMHDTAGLSRMGQLEVNCSYGVRLGDSSEERSAIDAEDPLAILRLCAELHLVHLKAPDFQVKRVAGHDLSLV